MNHVFILVAAHNEELTLPKCLQSLLDEPQVTPPMIYVVADHCTDRTADIARQFGVQVLEHDNPDVFGKGFGLAFGWRHLMQTVRPQIIILLDGDTWLRAGAMAHLVSETRRTGRPVQAAFLHKAADDAMPQQNLSEFAVLLKNFIRPLGLKRLGLPTLLTGGAMSFPVSILGAEDLADNHITEDMHLAINLAKQNTPPTFDPDAVVLSYLYNDQAAAYAQRKRWETGHISLIKRYGLSLMFEAFKTRNPALAAFSLELSVPPLSLYLLLMGALWIVSIAFGVGIVLGALSLSCTFLALAVAWWRFGRQDYPPTLFISLFPYVLRKVPYFWGALVKLTAPTTDANKT